MPSDRRRLGSAGAGHHRARRRHAAGLRRWAAGAPSAIALAPMPARARRWRSPSRSPRAAGRGALVYASAAGRRRSASRCAPTACRRVMLLATAVVIAAIGCSPAPSFATPPGAAEARAPLVFWMLLLAVWGALNVVFLGGDLFNLYVALELLTFAAVPLVCLDGRAETLRRRCATCCSRCSARCSICWARRCSTAPTARSTSSCWPARSAPSRVALGRRRR